MKHVNIAILLACMITPRLFAQGETTVERTTETAEERAAKAIPQAKPVAPPAPVNTNPWLKTPIEKILKKPECMIELNRETYLKSLKFFQNAIEGNNEKKQQVSTIHLSQFKSTMLDWMKLKYFECDTDISKAWLLKIADLFDRMYKCNQAMDMYEARNDDKNFEAYKKVYNQLIDLYIKEIQKPEKPSNKVTQELEKQKAQEQKAYKAYLKKTQKGKGGKGANDDDDDSSE